MTRLLNLAPLTAVVGRARSHNGDWTYHLATSGRWISMDSTNSTRSSYTTTPCSCSHQSEQAPSARLIIAAGILVTVAVGLALIIVGEHAADIARSSWGAVASAARSSWG